LDVKPIPPNEASAATAGYYMPPSHDGKRPGWFYVNTANLKERPTYEVIALSLHEAIPGHHIQHAFAVQLKNLPEFRKHLDLTAFVEGWALYAESLGDILGFFDDPYAKFGQLMYEMTRACRLVVDTGIHALYWSRDFAIQYMMQHTGGNLHDTTVEVDRYTVCPGQACAYKIGELKFKELRERAKTILGDRFDLRELHTVFLSKGALPLDILEDVVNQYIEDKKTVNWKEFLLVCFHCHQFPVFD